jgi:hypothetical protein
MFSMLFPLLNVKTLTIIKIANCLYTVNSIVIAKRCGGWNIRALGHLFLERWRLVDGPFIHSPKKHHWVGGPLLENECCNDMFLN